MIAAVLFVIAKMWNNPNANRLINYKEKCM